MEYEFQEIVRRVRSSSKRNKDLLREILQQSALHGLARHNFFEHAAFYGGTALRILYGLDRFSEDLDFSLLKPNLNFDFEPFLQGLQNEMSSFGFRVDVTPKRKDPPILSAFLKGNTRKLLLTIEDEVDQSEKTHPEEKITIKLEIDIEPPPEFHLESKLVLEPTPFYIVAYTLPSLFAGKMHALLCRAWKKRVKGRDWFDLIWYIRNKVPVHLLHLEKRMQQSGNFPKNKTLTHEKLLQLIATKIKKTDLEYAKEDVRVFLHDPKALDIWSEQFFFDLLPYLKSE